MSAAAFMCVFYLWIAVTYVAGLLFLRSVNRSMQSSDAYWDTPADSERYQFLAWIWCLSPVWVSAAAVIYPGAWLLQKIGKSFFK